MNQKTVSTFHVLICENDEFCLKELSDCIRSFSEELRLIVVIHSCSSMPLNSQDLIRLGNFVDFTIMNVTFDKKGIHICKELQKRNPAMPIILISDEECRAMWENSFFPVGLLRVPIDRELLRIFFHRALGQIIAGKMKQQCLSVTVGLTKMEIDFHSIILLKNVRSHVVIETKQGDFNIKNTLKEMKEKLPDNFFRINKGVIINSNEVLRTEKSDKKRWIIMNNNEIFTVSRPFVFTTSQLFND